MKKVVRELISIFIINMVLSNLLMREVRSENSDGLNFIKVEEGISSVKGNLEGLVLTLKNGQTNFLKGDQVIVLEGTNYSSVSNEIVVNEKGIVFSSNGDYFNEEDSNVLLDYLDSIKNDLDLKSNDSINLREDGFIITNKEDKKYNIKYYTLENDNYIINKEVNDIEAEYITFDEEGQIIILSDNIVSIYKEDGNIGLFNVPEGYEINYIDNNNYILFNESEYAIVSNYEEYQNVIDSEEIIDSIENEIATYEVLDEMPVSVLYETHVQSYGWQGWRTDGEVSGTSGEFNSSWNYLHREKFKYANRT